MPGANDWQFDAFRLAEATGGRALSCLGFFLISEAGLIKQFALRPLPLVRWVRADLGVSKQFAVRPSPRVSLQVIGPAGGSLK